MVKLNDKYTQSVWDDAAKNYISKYQKGKKVIVDFETFDATPTPPPTPTPVSPELPTDWFKQWIVPEEVKGAKPGELSVFAASYGIGKSTLKEKTEDTITPAAPVHHVHEEEEQFVIKKVTHPNPLHSYNDLEVVLSQLIEMITTAQAKGIEVPKMMLRVYHRLFNLEEQLKSKGDSAQYYKNGYVDGYHDGKHKLPHVYNDAPDEEEILIEDSLDDPDS